MPAMQREDHDHPVILQLAPGEILKAGLADHAIDELFLRVNIER